MGQSRVLKGLVPGGGGGTGVQIIVLIRNPPDVSEPVSMRLVFFHIAQVSASEALHMASLKKMFGSGCITCDFLSLSILVLQVCEWPTLRVIENTLLALVTLKFLNNFLDNFLKLKIH